MIMQGTYNHIYILAPILQRFRAEKLFYSSILPVAIAIFYICSYFNVHDFVLLCLNLFDCVYTNTHTLKALNH